MRAHVREAVLRVARKRGLSSGDTRGWSEISIRDVIAEAGISIGTFYKYFKDRSDLAQTLWLEPVNDLRSLMQARFDAAADPTEKVRALLDSYAGFALENRRLFRAAFLFVRPDDNPRPDPVALESEVLYRGLHAAFVDGQRSGDFRDFDPKEMAQLFWAAIHGSLALPENLDRFQFDPPAQLSANMVEALMQMIAAPPDQDGD